MNKGHLTLALAHSMPYRIWTSLYFHYCLNHIFLPQGALSLMTFIHTERCPGTSFECATHHHTPFCELKPWSFRKRVRQNLPSLHSNTNVFPGVLAERRKSSPNFRVGGKLKMDFRLCLGCPNKWSGRLSWDTSGNSLCRKIYVMGLMKQYLMETL